MPQPVPALPEGWRLQSGGSRPMAVGPDGAFAYLPALERPKTDGPFQADAVAAAINAAIRDRNWRPIGKMVWHCTKDGSRLPRAELERQLAALKPGWSAPGLLPKFEQRGTDAAITDKEGLGFRIYADIFSNDHAAEAGAVCVRPAPDGSRNWIPNYEPEIGRDGTQGPLMALRSTLGALLIHVGKADPHYAIYPRETSAFSARGGTMVLGTHMVETDSSGKPTLGQPFTSIASAGPVLRPGGAGAESHGVEELKRRMAQHVLAAAQDARKCTESHLANPHSGRGESPPKFKYVAGACGMGAFGHALSPDQRQEVANYYVGLFKPGGPAHGVFDSVEFAVPGRDADPNVIAFKQAVTAAAVEARAAAGAQLGRPAGAAGVPPPAARPPMPAPAAAPPLPVPVVARAPTDQPRTAPPRVPESAEHAFLRQQGKEIRSKKPGTSTYVPLASSQVLIIGRSRTSGAPYVQLGARGEDGRVTVSQMAQGAGFLSSSSPGQSPWASQVHEHKNLQSRVEGVLLGPGMMTTVSKAVASLPAAGTAVASRPVTGASTPAGKVGGAAPCRP